MARRKDVLKRSKLGLHVLQAAAGVFRALYSRAQLGRPADIYGQWFPGFPPKGSDSRICRLLPVCIQ